MKYQIKIDVHSYWHVGSGLGDGPGADALVIKTKNGLPYLPGKSLKGLLREAVQLAEDMGHITKGMTTEIFGTGLPGNNTPPTDIQHYFSTRAGRIHVSNAYLGETKTKQRHWKKWAEDPENQEKKQHLFQSITGIRMGKNHTVEDGALRTIEVSVPMPLMAEIAIDPTSDSQISEKEILEALEVSLPLFRFLGANRNRGLGRCTVSLEKAQGSGGAK